ncbi:fibronectin-binding protein [Mycolicibacterium mengxianglii]|uniref:fibronectin-binding protein n=1 Tax=Mycolicibacterium mengxianglii TaxID=2736649 RepID=UPI0018D0DE87|nr:fibronectin-binding protein [Mycolicibacterium mengxianglii]
MLVRIAALTGGLLLAGGLLAAPAPAEPGMPPCELALSFLCGMLPAMPQLDHDIDLTTELPPADALPEAPMADPCAAGCL